MPAQREDRLAYPKQSSKRNPFQRDRDRRSIVLPHAQTERAVARPQQRGAERGRNERNRPSLERLVKAIRKLCPAGRIRRS